MPGYLPLPAGLWQSCRKWLLAAWLAGLLLAPGLPAATLEGLKTLIGPEDAALVTAPDGRVLLAANADRQLVPASILKVLTALSALHYLGPDFRFQTDFYLDGDDNLIVRGSGDPLLVSEVLAPNPTMRPTALCASISTRWHSKPSTVGWSVRNPKPR